MICDHKNWSTYAEFRRDGAGVVFFFGDFSAGMVDASFLFAMFTACTAFCNVARALFNRWIAIFCVIDLLFLAGGGAAPVFRGRSPGLVFGLYKWDVQNVFEKRELRGPSS